MVTPAGPQSVAPAALPAPPSTPLDSLIGRTIDRYRLVAGIGRGGMGMVFKAVDERLQRTVAIKLLPPEMVLSTEARRRFLHEARAASKFDHPGIAAVHDAGEFGDQMYLVTAFVEGRSLRERLRDGPLPLAQAVGTARAVAESLQHAHDRGVIHRDVSSGNIIVGDCGRVTLIDFGLAHFRQDPTSWDTAPGTAMGTAPYLAPELILNREAGPGSDVYSLGVVLYEMLTGAPPFDGQFIEAIMNAVLNQQPPPPSARRPDVPAALDRLVLRALEKDPARRYPGPGAMLRDLDRLGLAADRPPGKALRHPPAAPRPARTPEGLPATKVLAVLPFQDASSPARKASAAQMFARGLAELVSARLARVPGVSVIPPSALPAGWTPGMDLVTLEREVGANLVLCGSIHRAGNRIRIVFSLVGTRRLQIAGDAIDGLMCDIFLLEDQLVRRVAGSLELEAATPPSEPLEAAPDPAAHEHYLQALGYLQHYEDEASVDGALRLLEALARSEGANARVLAALGRGYLAKYHLTSETDWERRAAEACRRALRLSSDLPEVLVTLATLQRETGRYRQAVESYGRALELRPEDPDALVDLAWTHELTGDMEQAEKILRQAAALRPTLWRIHNKLGVLHFKQARYEDAAAAWRRVLELDPDNPRAYSNLGSAYFHLGRYPEAVAACERALEIRPDARAYSNLGTICFFAGDRERAVQVLERSRDLRPSDSMVWGNLADAYRWAPGREERAADAFDRAIELERRHLAINRRDARGWTKLALWLAKRGAVAEALKALDRGLRLLPRDVDGMTRAVRVYHLAGDPEAALGWLAKAMESGCDIGEMRRDPELARLRDDPRFEPIAQGRRSMTGGT